MPSLDYWQDGDARAALLAQGRKRYQEIVGTLDAGAQVVAIEVASGEHFGAATLGKANDLAFERYPDRWLYFCRVDDPHAEILLPTW
jgi:hypothetical protein